MAGVIDVSVALELLGVGALAGLVGGLLGVGGGIIMIPAMLIFLGKPYGPNSIHVYKLAAISTSLVLSVPAVIRHTRAKAVVRAMLPGLLPAAVVGVLLGVWAASAFVGEHAPILRRIFGAFLELVVVLNVYQEWRALHGKEHLRSSCPVPGRRLLLGLVVGMPAGVIAGLLGIGGGVWAVPAQRQLLGIRIRNAIANSAVMIICIAIATSTSLSIWLVRLGDAEARPAAGWQLAGLLAPGALVGGWLGAGLTHRLPVRWLRYAFQLLLAATGIRLIVGN